MVLYHLIIILYTTMRPESRVFVDLFLSCAHDHSTEICGFLIFIVFLFTTIRPRLRVLTFLIFLYAHNHLIKICGPLPFIITFVHDHSTKIRRHSYSLIYHCFSCGNISFAIFMAYTALIIFHGFCFKQYCFYVLCARIHERPYIFRTVYSWWHCSYISYAMSMAV